MSDCSASAGAAAGSSALALLLLLLLAHQLLDSGDLGLSVGELLVALEGLAGRGAGAVLFERESFDAAFEHRFAVGELGDRLEQWADQH